uniref:DUF4371 domain-containing protein n=1 Tax=Panagrolaimus sp. ES5 TaxID=591445 RepID=A0AC34FV53_9BILA
MAKLVKKEVVDEIKDAKCFTILADETSTHSKEFLSICIRYVNKKFQIKEAFVGFWHISSTTGEALSDYILNILLEYGIDGKKMVAQGYDGASNMSGHINGTRAKIQKIYPQAEYYHCVNHKLNLSMEDVNENIVMKRAMQKFHDITVYLKSPHRASILSDQCENHKILKSKVPLFCQTRWVERHSSILAFKELIPAIADTLQIIAGEKGDPDVLNHLDFLYSAEAIFTLNLAVKVSAILKRLSAALQKTDLELISAYSCIEVVKAQLINFIEDEEVFEKLYKNAEKQCEELQIEINYPRSQRRRNQRSYKDFLKEDVFKDYINGLIKELNTRFGEKQQAAFSLQLLIPANHEKLQYENINKSVELYKYFLPDYDTVEEEIDAWKNYCNSLDVPTNSLQTALNQFDATTSVVFSNVLILLVILATIPVTTATVERSFSLLDSIFTDLRASMTSERLSFLSVLAYYVEETANLSSDKIIDKFMEKNRRSKF